MRGSLPQILVSAKESNVRNKICEVINSYEVPDLSNIGPGDFQFINVAGKQASIPRCKHGFEWNGRAVKELAGSGVVYICLTKSPYISSSSSSDEELVPYLESAGSTSTTTADECLRQSSAVLPRARITVTPAIVSPRLPNSVTPSSSAIISDESSGQQVLTNTAPPRASRTSVTPAVVYPSLPNRTFCQLITYHF